MIYLQTIMISVFAMITRGHSRNEWSELSGIHYQC